MTYASDVQLNLARLLEDNYDDFRAEELFEMELYLMDVVAVKRAGGEELVLWDASGELH